MASRTEQVAASTCQRCRASSIRFSSTARSRCLAARRLSAARASSCSLRRPRFSSRARSCSWTAASPLLKLAAAALQRGGDCSPSSCCRIASSEQRAASAASISRATPSRCSAEHVGPGALQRPLAELLLVLDPGLDEQVRGGGVSAGRSPPRAWSGRHGAFALRGGWPRGGRRRPAVPRPHPPASGAGTRDQGSADLGFQGLSS